MEEILSDKAEQFRSNVGSVRQEGRASKERGSETTVSPSGGKLAETG
jgi:hypothetical protein